MKPWRRVSINDKNKFLFGKYFSLLVNRIFFFFDKPMTVSEIACFGLIQKQLFERISSTIFPCDSIEKLADSPYPLFILIDIDD